MHIPPSLGVSPYGASGYVATSAVASLAGFCSVDRPKKISIVSVSIGASSMDIFFVVCVFFAIDLKGEMTCGLGKD
jgi:hypothetical protein